MCCKNHFHIEFQRSIIIYDDDRRTWLYVQMILIEFVPSLSLSRLLSPCICCPSLSLSLSGHWACSGPVVPVAVVATVVRCSSLFLLNLRLSYRHNNWETRTCPCRDFGRCPEAQLNVFVRTSARTWSYNHWANRTDSSMCLRHRVPP